MYDARLAELKQQAVQELTVGITLSRQLGFLEVQELLEQQVHHVYMMRNIEEIQSVIDIAQYRNSRFRARLAERDEK